MRAALSKPVISITAVAAPLIALAGCAGTPLWPYHDVLFQSKPAGAVVSLSDGQKCVTPCTLKLAQQNPRAVMFKHESCGEHLAGKVTLNWNGTLTVVDLLKNQTVTYHQGKWLAQFPCKEEKAT